jgi:hypothetical protein
MTHQEISEELTALVQLDVDAVVAYDRAISAIGTGEVATQLATFRLDHQRHVLELSQAMLDLGLRPPDARPDVKGSLLGGLTGLRARLGTEQALAAMRSNEQLTTSSYARALAKPFPDPILEIVRRGASDEQRHLSWIERALDGRIWEGAGAQP